MSNESFNATVPDFGIGTPYSESLRIFLILLGITYITFGTPGNILIVFTILKHKNLRVCLNMFTVNLALADTITLGYLVPFTVTDLLTGQYPGNQHICKINAILSSTAWFCSFFSILLIALSRYIKMCHDLWYAKIFSLRNTAMMCSTPWVLGFVSSFLYYPSEVGYIKNGHVCLPYTSVSHRYVVILPFVPLMFTSTAICYLKIIIKLHHFDKSLRNHGNEMFSRIRYNVDRKFVLSNLVIFVLFMVLCLPLFFTQIPKITVSATYYGIALSMLFANSAVNWLVYGVMNSSLRKSYKRIIPSLRKIQVKPGPVAHIQL